MANILNNITNYKDLSGLNHKQLQQLSAELVNYIIQVVTTNGGHLGSPLATVDLTLALLKTFNLDNNKIVWDIGHQAYAYKILTNRKNSFTTLRQYNGISGFSHPQESEFDLFTGGHSSTSISTAMGLKVGQSMQNNNGFVISVIGDASIAAGMALEALNHLGSTNYNNIVILNDNNMSIANSVGALHNYLTKVRTLPALKGVKKIFNKLNKKVEKKLFNNSNQILSNNINNLFSITNHNALFSNLGFQYYGPIDGHNIELMCNILENIKNSKPTKPILLHVNTTKGYGLQHENKKSMHAYSTEIKQPNTISNTNLFANTLTTLANTDSKIVAITAAMPSGTGLSEFAKHHKTKMFDVGIAEQHAVGFAAGLAKAGLKPFVCIYSTFLQRCYDQIIHDVTIEELPVKFVLDRGGFVGADGCTHAGLHDYSMLGCLPNFTVMASVFAENITQMLSLMANHNKPISLRFNRANAISHTNYISNLPALQHGKGCVLHTGQQVAIIGLGEILLQAFKANNILKNHNINCTIADARFLSPLDEDLIVDLAKNHSVILTLEEGMDNIFGAKVLHTVNKNNLLNNVLVNNLYVSKKFLQQASIAQQIKACGLNAESIANKILQLLKK